MQEYSYIMKVLIAVDQLVNTILGGDPDETLSAKSYRLREDSPISYKVINKIFFWQEDHCKQAYVSEVLRKHLSTTYSKES